jgi:hypothetical protein
MTMKKISLIALVVTVAGLVAGCGGDSNGSTDNNNNGQQAPSVSSVTPVIGPTDGGTEVTITGANFQTGATVTFKNGAATEVTVVSSSKITAKAPAHTKAEFVDVKVVNPDSQEATRTGAYLYCFADPTTNDQIINGCPPSSVQYVNKDPSAAIAPYLVNGELPALP